MSFSKFRKASGRWWGNLRGQKNREDDFSECENENNRDPKNGQPNQIHCSHADCQQITNKSRCTIQENVPQQRQKEKGTNKEDRCQITKGKNMEVYDQEHITIASVEKGTDYIDSYSVYSSEPGRNKLSENKKTEKSQVDTDIPLLSDHEKRELVSLVRDKNISMDFILEMKEAFLLFDKNGDGFISAKELGVLMRAMGRNPTEDEIMQMMNEIDVDHNGKLDFSEFTIMMREKLQGEDMEEEIRQAFRVFDSNGDGYISKTEFKHCMMHFGEQFTDEEVEEMIAEADSNNDGQIDYEEFSKMLLDEIG